MADWAAMKNDLECHRCVSLLFDGQLGWLLMMNGFVVIVLVVVVVVVGLLLLLLMMMGCGRMPWMDISAAWLRVRRLLRCFIGYYCYGRARELSLWLLYPSSEPPPKQSPNTEYHGRTEQQTNPSSSSKNIGPIRMGVSTYIHPFQNLLLHHRTNQLLIIIEKKKSGSGKSTFATQLEQADPVSTPYST
jgi:hypothetical protein